jgi:hypothetical protein
LHLVLNCLNVNLALSYQAESVTTSTNAQIRRATNTYYKRMMRNYSKQVGLSGHPGDKENLEMKQLSNLRDAKCRVGTSMHCCWFDLTNHD